MSHAAVEGHHGAPRRLLFLPGAGADPDFWRPLGSRLPSDWDKIYFGWPGLGHQPPSPMVGSFDSLVAMVVAELGDTPVDLLAQSMGGAIALRVALDHPHRVRRLVLAVTAGGLDLAALGGADWRPAYQLEYPNAQAWIINARPNYADELARVQHPTLLLWGDADPISPLAVGERLHELLPQSHLLVVTGGDHGFVHERPSDIIDAIAAHLR